MTRQFVTIAAFPQTNDPGLQALSQLLKEFGIPYQVDELEPESPEEFWANALPYRLRTAYIDRSNAYQLWSRLLSQNNPYVEVTEADLERLAMETAHEEAVSLEESPPQTTWGRILEGPDIQAHTREGIDCPIDPDLAIWIDEQLSWISTHLFNPLEKRVITLEDFADWEYMADLEDAEFVLSRSMELMDIPPETNISLYFMQSDSAEGLYHTDGAGHYIGIEVSTLWNSAWLIDVIAHELCHYQLIGKRPEMPEYDELLTDLLVVAYGFGLIKGNESFIAEQEGTVQGQWAYLRWRVGRRGYLPRPMIAFAMALIEFRRSGTLPDWHENIDPVWRDDFNQSMAYIEYFSDDFTFGAPS